MAKNGGNFICVNNYNGELINTYFILKGLLRHFLSRQTFSLQSKISVNDTTTKIFRFSQIFSMNINMEFFLKYAHSLVQI